MNYMSTIFVIQDDAKTVKFITFVKSEERGSIFQNNNHCRNCDIQRWGGLLFPSLFVFNLLIQNLEAEPL